jgi:dienelactone hydrolase
MYAVGMEVAGPATVWYPAARAGAPLRYGDYVDMALRDAPGPDGTPRTRAGYVAFLQGNGVPQAGIEAWLGAPMSAARGARPAKGRFPIVLIAPGNGGAVQDEAVLGEYRAAHGYVAAVVSSPGWRGREMKSEADVLPVAREQAIALVEALDRVSALRYADRARWGVVGYSFGARAALLVAGRRPGMRALVSLAGGIGSAEAKDWLPAEALDRAAIAVPILHIYDDADPSLPPDFTLLQSLPKAMVTLSKVAGLGHFDLITFGLASARVPGLAGPDADAQASRIERVLEATVAFLDQHLR